MKFKIHTRTKSMLADTITPVSIYLRLRDRFPNSVLLESSEHQGGKNSYSSICCKPIAGIRIENDCIETALPDGTHFRKAITGSVCVKDALQAFLDHFSGNEVYNKINCHGLFGYMSYESVQYFETIELKSPKNAEKEIPVMIYQLYEYVLVIDHFKDELHIHQNSVNSDLTDDPDEIETIIKSRNIPSYRFERSGEESSNFEDAAFLKVIRKAKEHCKRGDVFQMVLSRGFFQSFKGDDFNVYRALRSVNPSPYLFYFDYGNFKLFGSSPEAQLVVKGNIASVHPIAGTFKRTGNDEADALVAEKLKHDRKENAEHVMLVDLARNDLSKSCEKVAVHTFREIQYYSHVIHLVSNVEGQLKRKGSTMNIVADTFPAGTLSGAPKHRAMQLIDKYENGSRSFYGGCVGFMGFNGDFNHAIMIRSFLSKNNTLFYQAGAGVVESSNEKSELNEVNNKLAALKSAISIAEEIV